MRYTNSHYIILPVAMARSSSDKNAICHVLPVLGMTSRFHRMTHMLSTARLQFRSHARLVGQDYVIFGRGHQVAAPVGGRVKRASGEFCYPQLPCYFKSIRAPQDRTAQADKPVEIGI